MKKFLIQWIVTVISASIIGLIVLQIRETVSNVYVAALSGVALFALYVPLTVFLVEQIGEMVDVDNKGDG